MAEGAHSITKGRKDMKAFESKHINLTETLTRKTAHCCKQMGALDAELPGSLSLSALRLWQGFSSFIGQRGKVWKLSVAI